MLALDITQLSWYADLVNLLVNRVLTPVATTQQKKLNHDARIYIWDESLLFKQRPEKVVRRCIPKNEVNQVQESCHLSPYEGCHQGERTDHKVLQSGLFWPTLLEDVAYYVKECDQCQRMGAISKRHEMLLNNNLEVEIVDTRGINFMGPFPPSNGNQYILVTVDFVPKLVEVVALSHQCFKGCHKVHEKTQSLDLGLQELLLMMEESISLIIWLTIRCYSISPTN